MRKKSINRCSSEELREAVESSISEVIKKKINNSSNFFKYKRLVLIMVDEC